mmetsp:Transcript_9885/g.24701  ORF Transcript_9885/g.24701 Transcript_9885/m.24701 type:complete len:266 (+) Transcript_9885:705-1502(+)
MWPPTWPPRTAAACAAWCSSTPRPSGPSSRPRPARRACGGCWAWTARCPCHRVCGAPSRCCGGTGCAAATRWPACWAWCTRTSPRWRATRRWCRASLRPRSSRARWTRLQASCWPRAASWSLTRCWRARAARWRWCTDARTPGWCPCGGSARCTRSTRQARRLSCTWSLTARATARTTRRRAPPTPPSPPAWTTWRRWRGGRPRRGSRWTAQKCRHARSRHCRWEAGGRWRRMTAAAWWWWSMWQVARASCQRCWHTRCGRCRQL